MDSAPTARPYLTVKEAALYLRVHVSTVRRQIKSGKIRVITVGRRKRIPTVFLLSNT